MTCRKCGSENVSIQAVTISKMVNQHHGCLWWILWGWFWVPMKWLFLTLPAIIFKIFGHGKQKIKTKTHNEAVCQNCGNRWKI